ncbi:MAG: hypothetical protein L6R38_007904 [Xanthoria sp. 2 TBL-2021]|nr:MAG: hypothetical protein L6R38_007904 [Xanthoria sp. 2 TBL-2021]
MACSLIPSEIRLRIFECCPDVPTAASLAQASKPFNSTWMSYKKSICPDILKRTVECYQDAINLVTQDIFDSHVTTEVLEQSFEPFTTSILANAKAAEHTYDTIIHDPSLFGPIREYDHSSTDLVQEVDGLVILNLVERQRFVSAWYKIRTVSAMLQQQRDRDFPACLPKTTSNYDVFLLLEVARTVLEKTASKDIRQKLGMDIRGVQQWDLPMEILMFTPDPQDFPWEAAMVHLKRIAFVRVNEAGLRSMPGEDWNLRVLLDAYQPVLQS